MDIEFITICFVVLLLTALVAEPVSRALKLPHASVLLILGAAIATFVTQVLGIDTGLRTASFHDLIFFVFLPLLVFEAAFNIPLKALGKDLGIILFLAIVGMLLTTVISAALIYLGIGHPTGFPWVAALLTGALLSATDPVAVVAQLKSLGAPERLGVLLEGESLFNDATAIVVFMLFLGIAQMGAVELSLSGAAIEFLVVFLGGAVIGVLVGLVGAALVYLDAGKYSSAAIVLIVAYASYLIAEMGFHVSGVMGSLSAGLVLARLMNSPVKGATGDHEYNESFLGTLSYFANSCVFLLMGVTVTVAMFTERWLAMLIAIVGVLIARMCVTYGGLALLNQAISNPVPHGYPTVIVWGGLRGAVTLALALSLPTSLEYWWTIQSMAFGVVLFTLLVQAPTMAMLVRSRI